MDLPGPRWKKGKDGQDSAAVAAAHPMSSIVAHLQSSLRDSAAVALLSGQGRHAFLAVGPDQAELLNRAAFGLDVGSAGDDRRLFELGPEEVFFLCHALKCITVATKKRKRMDFLCHAPKCIPVTTEKRKHLDERELWDLLTSTSERFPEMYKAYQHLRLKNWVVKSGLQYGAHFVAYRHHPALVHSEFSVVVVPEGKAFGTRCGHMKAWSHLLCALRASGSVAKTLLVLTISTKSSVLRSSACLEQMAVHERTIMRWIPQQCREQQDRPCREEATRDENSQKPCREEATRDENSQKPCREEATRDENSQKPCREEATRDENSQIPCREEATMEEHEHTR